MVKIDSVKFGEMRVNGKDYYSDLTVSWDGKVSFREKKHTVEMGDLIRLIKMGAKTVVIGAGNSGTVKIAPEVPQWLSNERISLYVEKTPRAAELFNAFANEGKKVVGIFHVTC